MMQRIPEFSKYGATADGRVWSHGLRKKWLKPTTDRNGYLRLRIVNDKGEKKSLYVHRIVASLYAPNPENKYYVNHLDNNPSNNRVSNLEWCTHAENMQHSARQGRRPSLKGENNPSHKYSNSIVRQVRRLYADGTSQMDIKRQLGIPQPTISAMVRKAQWRHI